MPTGDVELFERLVLAQRGREALGALVVEPRREREALEGRVELDDAREEQDDRVDFAVGLRQRQLLRRGVHELLLRRRHLERVAREDAQPACAVLL